MRETIKLFVVLTALTMGFFTSCVPDPTDPTAPAISITAPTADTTIVFIGDSINFEISLSSNNGLKSLSTLTSDGGVTLTNGSLTFAGSSYETAIVTATITDAVAPGTEITVTFTVIDGELQTSVKKVIVAEANVTPLSEAKDFTWVRIAGAAGINLDQFGLSWKSNTETSAIIKKAADKFVELDAAQWLSLTNLEGLKEAIDAANDMTQWDGVSVSLASKTYDVVLGTIKDGTYYLIHVTQSTAVKETGSTNFTYTIIGQYKE